ncbi:catalase [Aspergillus brunneoviolaceus CBS 621.78]|uniref:Catalase n=1 Tax=Aspergillus brunneoviolaceus CBS 621.78 TaxID=1450534 RepID=A0ACD1GAW9_9EURO|nr:putative catalase [Aspergillus brunneoviolaceus CBS 621.78]RAH46312.1 putative catalase [Aspergillus brunneoviolaceus CBS 621.78]
MSKPTFTLAEGQPVTDPAVSTTLPTFGGGGLTTLGDTLLIETLTHFNRERIPERVVHAKGSGAWGEFRVTKDISHLTKAKFLTGVGKKTKVLFRHSTTGGGLGSADTALDIHGFAVKFFTEEGNHDIVGNHAPVFWVRDPIRFPAVNRSHKKHPATNRGDPNMFWDFHVNQPESVHALMHLFGSRGHPESARKMTGFGIHTFKLVSEDGSFRYCKFHFKPVQGISNISSDMATRLAGTNPDSYNQDLWEAIARGDHPVWKLYVQVMEPERAETFGRALFDITKVWPHKDFPLIEVGEMTLNRNPENFFAEIEQAAFSPSNLVPGVAATPDPMLQARMFAYPDAQRYRLGVNYPQLPPNKPVCPVYAPYLRDGAHTTTHNYGGDPNYVRSTLTPGVSSPSAQEVRHHEFLRMGGVLGLNEIPVDDEDFVQPRALWHKVFDEQERRLFVTNLCNSLEGVVPELQQATVAMFSRVDPRIGQMMEANLKGGARL